jgi:nucleoside 2-deoxyribosyltransferase
MRVFLAAPFTQVMGLTGLVEGDFKEYLLRVHGFLEDLGYEVISAHVREEWGEQLDSPAQAAALDFAGIDNSDALVALVGMAPSEGVPLEIGYAVGRGRPTVIVQAENEAKAARPYSIYYLLEGLPSVAHVRVGIVKHLADTERAIKDGLDRVIKR